MPAVTPFFLYFAYLLFFLWLIRQKKFFQSSAIAPKWFLLAFGAKVLGGAFLIAIYTYYYTDPAKADIYRYFNDGLVVSNVLWTSPLAWLKIMTNTDLSRPEVFVFLQKTQYYTHPLGGLVTNNTLLIRLHALLNFFTLGNIYTNTLFMNFFSFVGMVALWKSVLPFFKNYTGYLFAALFFIPSVVFWSSGPLKEQLVFAFMGFYLYLLAPACTLKPAVRYPLIVVALLGVVYVKPPIAAVLVGSSLFLPLFRFYETKKLIAAAVLLLIALVPAAYFGLTSRVCALLLDERNRFITLSLQENAGSLLDAHLLHLSCTNLGGLLPAALLQTIFGPYLWQTHHIFNGIFAVENTILWGSLCYLLFRFFRIPQSVEARLLATFCFVFAFSFCLLIAITVPVMGAIVHYRIVATPFFVMAALLCTRPFAFAQKEKAPK